jgi:hypothetical protein
MEEGTMVSNHVLAPPLLRRAQAIGKMFQGPELWTSSSPSPTVSTMNLHRVVARGRDEGGGGGGGMKAAVATHLDSREEGGRGAGATAAAGRMRWRER